MSSQTATAMHFQPIEPMDDDAHLTRAQAYHIEAPAATNDALDDVFGSGPSSPTGDGHDAPREAAHPSDMHRLQTEHTNNGYREGVTVAKESSLQAGFDEGFSLGASIGDKAGRLLGLLEGIAEAVSGGGPGDAGESARKLLQEAQAELAPERIFSPEYWAADGNWTFPVEGADVVFADVAAAHPLVRKWTRVVDAQVVLWRIDPRVLDDQLGERLESAMDEPIVSTAAPAAKKPLDW